MLYRGAERCFDTMVARDVGWIDRQHSSAPFRVYNIGNNRPVELMRYIEVLEECLGRKAEKNMLPLQLGDVPCANAEGAARPAGPPPTWPA